MKKVYRCLFFIILGLVILSIKTTVNAASLNITASKQKLNVGEKATITVSSDSTGSVNVSANGGTLEGDKVIWVEKNSQSGITITSNKAGKITVTATPTDGTLSYNYKDEAVKAKSVTVEFVDNTAKETENNNSAGNNANNTSDASNIETNNAKKEESNNEQKESQDSNNKEEKNNNKEDSLDNKPAVVTSKSSNANLSDLGIRPNDFRGFKPNITSYDVTVPNDVAKIEVYSKTQDDKAKVSVNGNRNLEVGKNVFEITVRAEDGTTKVYNINVTRQEADKKEESQTENNNDRSKEENQTASETTQTVSTNSTESSDLKKLEIVGYTISPTFSSNIYEYKLEVPQDVSSLEVKTEAGNTNVQIDVAGNKDLKEGENVVTVVCTNKETKKTSTYQIIVNKKIAENPHADAINEAMKKRNLIIKVGVGIIIVLVILCIIVFKKGNDEENEVVEKKPKRLKEKHYNENEEKSNEEFKQLLENKKNRNYTDEELEEIRKRRIAERENRERQVRQHINNNLNNEDVPKGLQKEKIQDFSMTNAEKVQRARDQEFDEKLERIRRERNNDRKGGKHF